jgi:hypothetical protein
MKKIALVILLTIGLACSSVHASGTRNFDPHRNIALGISEAPSQKCSSAVRMFTDIMNWFFVLRQERKNK